MKKYPPELQAAIKKAGVEAGAFNREIQAREDQGSVDKMVAAKQARVHPFTERAKLLEISNPIVAEFAKEAGVEKMLADMQAVK
jgi:TRAP-type C4-dicarboxylate transport system substrate-binding protein